MTRRAASSVELICQRQHDLAGKAALKPLIYDEHVSNMADGQDLAIFACVEPRLSLVNLGHQFGRAVVGRIPGAYMGPYRKGTAEAATVAIALNKGVSNIVIMGHTDCGAMHCACGHGDNKGMADVLDFLAPVLKFRDGIKDGQGDAQDRAEANRQLAQKTVQESLENLKTYPGVQARIDAGTLQVHGWLMDLEKAQAKPPRPFLYELDQDTFRLMADAPQKGMQDIQVLTGGKIPQRGTT